MSFPSPNPMLEPINNQNLIYYRINPVVNQYQPIPTFILSRPAEVYGWCIQPNLLPSQNTAIPVDVSPPVPASKGQYTANINNENPDNPRGPDRSNSESTSDKHSPRRKKKPSVIPTTKFINETFDFGQKPRSRRRDNVEKSPDLQLSERVKEVLKQFELNQKALAMDLGCSETMVSQWINGTVKATGWASFEKKIRIWLNQEHKKPEKGPTYDFIDESSRLKSKFLRKSKK